MYSFSTEWVKTVTKDGFIAHCKDNHKGMSERDLQTIVSQFDSLFMVVEPVASAPTPEGPAKGKKK